MARNSGIEIAGATGADASARAEAILRTLPDWFGIEESLLAYARNAGELACWIARVDGRDAGFITVRRHYPEAGEIDCVAVRPEFHRAGVGRDLVRAVERDLNASGARVLHVKTLGPSRPCEFYEKTLRFYLGMGFSRLEESLTIWGGMPCLILAKPL